jgi:hypothetical protein
MPASGPSQPSPPIYKIVDWFSRTSAQIRPPRRVEYETRSSRDRHGCRVAARDLPHRVEALGPPVTVVTAKQAERGERRTVTGALEASPGPTLIGFSPIRGSRSSTARRVRCPRRGRPGLSPTGRASRPAGVVSEHQTFSPRPSRRSPSCRGRCEMNSLPKHIATRTFEWQSSSLVTRTSSRG